MTTTGNPGTVPGECTGTCMSPSFSTALPSSVGRRCTLCESLL